MQTPVYTVLVIEDDLPLKMLIAQHLASLNYNVLTARSWKDAQALLELNEPDLIILDIRLPDANGLDLIKGLAARLRGHRAHRLRFHHQRRARDQGGRLRVPHQADHPGRT